MADHSKIDRSVKKVFDSTFPFYVSPSDNPGMLISSCILKGENYDMWVKAMRNALRAKNKLGFVDGTITKPKSGDFETSMWGICNSMMVCWLFNSIDPTLQPSIAYFETAKELWDDLRERFSVGNAARVYQLKADIAAAKQQGQTVVTYYTRLKGMWDELGSYLTVPICKCGCCKCNLVGELMKEREEEKIHQFLMGLDDAMFGTVRTNILSMDPIPNLSKVYSMVVQEERHRSVVRGRNESGEAVGFAVNVKRTESNQQKGGLGDRVSCTHCGKTGHEATRCFEIIGYPEGWGRGGRGNRGGRGGIRGKGRGRVSTNAVQGNNNNSPSTAIDNSQSKIPGLTDAQMKQIMAILSQSNVSNSNGSEEKLHGKVTKTCWLLDSGASHHMTGDIECLQYIYQIAPVFCFASNGEHIVAEQEGTVFLDGIILKRVLYVLSLNCNLISLSSLINDSDCFVTFTNEICVLQDLTSRMLMGVGEKKDEVYYYCSGARVHAYHVRRNENFWLWHQRMGHPSALITSLFLDAKISSCNSKDICEICMQAKQTREPFHVSFNKAVESFALIHCNIWGPYRISSHRGAHYFFDNC